MKIQYISGALFMALLFAFAPNADAYFTTNQIASKFTEQAAVFAIQYEFGLKDKDIYMPIIAERGLQWENDEKKVGYSFKRNKDETVSFGTATALVLSSAPIVDGMYKIEKGTSKMMTLFAVLTTSPNAHEMDYALQVDSLPYYMDKGNGELTRLQLNPSELKYYVTEEIELNTGNFD